MLVVIVLMVVTVAQFIAHPLAAALDDMHEMMLTEECQRPEDVRLVDTQDPVFQFPESDGMQGFHQFFQHHDAVSRRLDAVLLQQLCTLAFVHTPAKIVQIERNTK